MRTTLELDGDLLEEAMELSGKTTKRGTIETALEEYIQKRKARLLHRDSLFIVFAETFGLKHEFA